MKIYRNLLAVLLFALAASSVYAQWGGQGRGRRGVPLGIVQKPVEGQEAQGSRHHRRKFGHGRGGKMTRHLQALRQAVQSGDFARANALVAKLRGRVGKKQVHMAEKNDFLNRLSAAIEAQDTTKIMSLLDEWKERKAAHRAQKTQRRQQRRERRGHGRGRGRRGR